MNYKAIGDIGVNATIGHLARFGLGIAFPLSDNYPFDLVVIANNQLFRAQIKTSSQVANLETIIFDFSSNNWYSGEIKKYTTTDCDIIFGYDITKDRVFVFEPKNFSNRRTITIRYETSASKQLKLANLAKDFELSKDKVKEIFNFDCPELKVCHIRTKKEYEKICETCGVTFFHNYKNAKYCSSQCRNEGRAKKYHSLSHEKIVDVKDLDSNKIVVNRFKVPHPSREELEKLVWEKPLIHVAKDFGVSDNAVRKWCKKENITLPQIGYWNRIFAEKQKSQFIEEVIKSD